MLESLDIALESARGRSTSWGLRKVTSAQIPFTPRAEKVLELALREALSFGHPVEIILDPPPQAETAKLLDLLLAFPREGRVKASKALRRARISPSKTLGGLSERQRSELVELLRRPGGPYP